MSRPEDTVHGRCQATAKSTGEQCGRAAIAEHGKCDIHGGKGGSPDGNQNATNNSGGSAPAQNTNGITHGAYANEKKLYSETFSERERDLTDRIFAGHIERYTDRHGTEPPIGFELRLFNIAVNSVTEMRVENWYTDKPDDLDTGTGAPHIDRETHISEQGERYYRYKKSPALAAMKHLSDYNHKWLKNFSLLPDADTQQAEAMGSVLTILADEARTDGSGTTDENEEEAHAHGNS